MGPVYVNDYIARIMVEERLNYPRRKPVISDNFHPWRTIRNAAAMIATIIQQLTKSISKGLKRWADTQTACTWQDGTLVNC